jgi:site-specific DNA-cytosine methylase
VTLLASQYAKMTPGRIMVLREKVAALHSLTGGQLSIGTGCSGTDIVIHAIQLVLQSWITKFGIDIRLKHAMSCESSIYKQQFILDHFQPQHLFPDLHLLHGSQVADMNGTPVVLPHLHIWACGIECDSISGLNTGSHLNKDCIAEEEGAPTKTGSTARSCMEVVKQKKPVVFILENIKNLSVKSAKDGQLSNLETLIALGNAMGYYMVTALMDTACYGIPQTRERFYIIGVRISADAVDQLVKDYPVPVWVADFLAMLQSLQVDALPLCRFLLPADDEEVLTANTARCVEPQQKKKQKRIIKPTETTVPSSSADDVDKVEKYKVEHLGAYTAAGVPWPPVYDFEFSAKSECLVPRQQQILWLDEKLNGPTSALKKWVVKDLNMTLEWGRCLENIFPCIVSTSTLWLRGPVVQDDGKIIRADRLLAGAELLSMQGVSLDLQSKSRSNQLCNKHKSDLAGNAFSGNIVLAVFLTLITCGPLEVAFELITSVPATTVHKEDSDGGLESEDEDGESETQSDPDVGGSNDEHSDFDL